MPKMPPRTMPEPYYRQDNISIYHGDCRELLPLLADGLVDFVFTDPPYGHSQNEGDLLSQIAKIHPHKNAQSHRHQTLANDRHEDISPLIQWSFAEWNRLLKPGCCCCCCCCGGGGPDPQFARWSLWLDEAVGFKQMVVWDKGPMGMGWHYHRSYETVLVGEKPGAACRWYDDTKRIENIIRPGNWGIKKIIPSQTEHPTEKPVELAKHFIRLHTRSRDLVLDPFMGAGSTALACLDLNRRFIGIDCGEEHVKNAVDRLKNAGGNGFMMQVRKARKLGGRTKR